MNKFLQKVAKIFLGLSMAAGVGVAVADKPRQAVSTDAANTKVAFTTGSNTVAIKVNWNSAGAPSSNNGVRMGTSSNAGSATFSIPSGTTKFGFYAVGWKGKSTTASVSASVGTIASSTASLTSNSAATGTINADANVAITETEANAKKEFTISSVTAASTITLTTSGSNKRLIAWDAYYVTQDVTYTVSFAVNTAGYGTVSRSSITSVPSGTSISTSNNTVTINGTTVTATPTANTAQYTYAFTGWSNTSGSVDAARTITANFSRTTNTFTVDGSGISNGSLDNSSSIEYGDDLEVNIVPSSGFTYPSSVSVTMGGSDISNEVAYENGYLYYGPVTGNIVITATCLANTVTYNANGGSVSIASEQIATNGHPTFPTPTKSGYNFKGWQVNGSGTAYTSPNSYTVTGDVTFVASWVAVYTVTFNANGGSSTPGSQSVESGSTFTFPAAPGTKTHYSFDGWTSTGGEPYHAAGATSPAVTGNITYTAHWTEDDKFDVTYECGDHGTGNDYVINDVYTGTSHQLVSYSSTNFEADSGYAFKCWSVGGVEKDPGESVEITSTTTITAVYKEVTTYTLVTNPTTLTDGTTFVLVGYSNSTYRIAKGLNSGHVKMNEITSATTISNGVASGSTLNSTEADEFTLKASSNSWEILDSSGNYLQFTGTSNGNDSWTESSGNNTKFTISGDATIDILSNTQSNRYWRYNTQTGDLRNGASNYGTDIYMFAATSATGAHTVSTTTVGLTLDRSTIGDSGTVTLTTAEKKKLTSVAVTGSGSQGTGWTIDGNVITLSAVTDDVTINGTISDAWVTSIEVSGQTIKFDVGEDYNFDGTVTATYDDFIPVHTSEVIDSGFTVDSSDYDKNTGGTYTISVTHNGGHAEAVEFNVQVLETQDYGVFSSDLVEGYYIITADYSNSTGALTNTINGGGRADYTTVSVSNNKIKTGDPGIVWQLIKNGDYWNIKSTDSSVSSTPFIASNGNANSAQMLASGDNTAAQWTITNSSGDYLIRNVAQTSRYLKRNENYGFACYQSNVPVQMYKLLELEVSITTEADKDNVLIGSTHAITLNESLANYKGSSHAAFTTLNTSVINLTDNGNGTASVYGKTTGTATVTATLDGKTGTITLTVVRTLTGIEITTDPTKTVYTEGQTFDPTGMVVVASFDGDTDKTLTSEQYTCTPTGELGTSDTEVVVSYTENGVTETDTVSITVNEIDRVIDHIAWTAPSTQHYDNEYLTLANVEAFAVKAHWVEDGKTNPTDVALGTYTLKLGTTEIKASDLPRRWTTGDSGKALTVEYKGQSLSVTMDVIEHINSINGEGQSSSVSFDATSVTGTSPLSLNPISMSCTSGTLNNGSEYRLFKSSTTTFTATDALITRIDFTGQSSNPVSNFEAQSGFTTSGYDGTWVGKASSVSFFAETAQVRCTEIVVTYVPLTDISNTNFIAQKTVLEFTNYFNEEMGCNAGGSTTNVAGKWTDIADEFHYWFVDDDKDLTDPQKAHAIYLFAHGSSGESGDSLQQMLAKYDYILAKYNALGYELEDFLHEDANRTAVGARPNVNPLTSIIGENTNTVAIIVIISMVSVTAIGGYFFLRKRKENI